MKLQDKLKQLRKSRGLSQQELSERSGISLRMINYYEKKAVSIPIKKINKLAVALGINIEELINEKEDIKNLDPSFDISNIKIQKLKKIQELLDLPIEYQNYIFKLVDLLKKKNK